MTDHPGGQPTFAVEPAGRPDGREVRFDVRSGDTIAGAPERYVIPSDAREPISAGTLDKELFNITGLVREGMDRLDFLPLIVRHDGPLATGNVRALPTIGASAVRIDRSAAADFWGTARTSVRTVTLDHRRRPALDVSVPRIGAPRAWQAGHDGTGVIVAVIDSGIDNTHPDLAGQLVAERNFTEDPDATDVSGHGTHVAATIAGSGAASGGRFKGVAPGAKLINAKAMRLGRLLPRLGPAAGQGLRRPLRRQGDQHEHWRPGDRWHRSDVA